MNKLMKYGKRNFVEKIWYGNFAGDHIHSPELTHYPRINSHFSTGESIRQVWIQLGPRWPWKQKDRNHYIHLFCLEIWFQAQVIQVLRSRTLLVENSSHDRLSSGSPCRDGLKIERWTVPGSLSSWTVEKERIQSMRAFNLKAQVLDWVWNFPWTREKWRKTVQELRTRFLKCSSFSYGRNLTSTTVASELGSIHLQSLEEFWISLFLISSLFG